MRRRLAFGTKKTKITKVVKDGVKDGLPATWIHLPICEPRKMAAHTGNIRSYIMGKVMGDKAT